MNPASLLIIALYLIVVVVVCLYGAHRYWMVWTMLKLRRAQNDSTPGVHETGMPEEKDLPRVTVQLPMFNEQHVAERIITAACAIEYPQELLEIQVLDDSTDESREIARRCCERMTRKGHAIAYIHRDNRQGFKAGALAAGMEIATGEFIAIFDADFVPPPDILKRTIGCFADPNVGMVQTRWSHINRNDSLLTRIQAMCLDAHFLIEQNVRARTGRWFNFNGTAGVWRASCIDDAGGWRCDTLTEDTDLSYRAQLQGWDFKYLPDVLCPAELPPTIAAFSSQQHRWNKGLIQTGMKLLPRIMRSHAPWTKKVEAWFHLTSPIVHAMIFLLSLLAITSMLIPVWMSDVHPFIEPATVIAFLMLGAFTASVFYIVSQRLQGERLIRTLLQLPALMALGVGISFVNTCAVFGALCGRRSPFVRTPKFNGRRSSDVDPISQRRRGVRMPAGVVEMTLGAGLMASCMLAAIRTVELGLIGTPFLLMFSLGFLTVGWARVRDVIDVRHWLGLLTTGAKRPVPQTKGQPTS